MYPDAFNEDGSPKTVHQRWAEFQQMFVEVLPHLPPDERSLLGQAWQIAKDQVSDFGAAVTDPKRRRSALQLRPAPEPGSPLAAPFEAALGKDKYAEYARAINDVPGTYAAEGLIKQMDAAGAIPAGIPDALRKGPALPLEPGSTADKAWQRVKAALHDFLAAPAPHDGAGPDVAEVLLKDATTPIPGLRTQTAEQIAEHLEAKMAALKSAEERIRQGASSAEEIRAILREAGFEAPALDSTLESDSRWSWESIRRNAEIELQDKARNPHAGAEGR